MNEKFRVELEDLPRIRTGPTRKSLAGLPNLDVPATDKPAEQPFGEELGRLVRAYAARQRDFCVLEKQGVCVSRGTLWRMMSQQLVVSLELQPEETRVEWLKGFFEYLENEGRF